MVPRMSQWLKGDVINCDVVLSQIWLAPARCYSTGRKRCGNVTTNMVKIGLQIKCQLENVTDLTAEGEDFRWYLKLKCANCGEETPDFVYLSLTDSQPLKGGRGHASLVIKCKLCARENSIDIIADSIKRYTADDSNKYKTIVAFDCRGVEPTAFSPRVGWTASGVNEESEPSGCVFNDVSLTDGEWADYDEKSSLSVGIYEIEHKFVNVK